MFYKEVDIQNREEMVLFLKNHFRYYTMNSWNLITSFANNVKLYNLSISKEYLDKAYSLLEIDDTYDHLSYLFKEFEQLHTEYMIGRNGRSGGYLVLYTSNNQSVSYGNDYDDYEEYDLEDLIIITKLIQDFDKFCDDLTQEFIHLCKHGIIVEEEYVEVKKIKRLEI